MEEFVQSGAVFGHLAALLLVLAMFRTDIRSIRWVAMGSALAALVFVLLSGVGLVWILWALALAMACGLQLLRLESRRRSGKMLPEERELFAHVMQVQEPAQQRRLSDLMRWEDIAEGALLMEDGQSNPPLIYVASGSARITHDAHEVGRCGAGDFLGEMSIVSGARASASVTAAEPMRIARFDRDALAQLANEMPEISKAINAALNRSLAQKLVRMNEEADEA